MKCNHACRLCEKGKVKYVMRNNVNGKVIGVCKLCYQEIWGEVK